MQQSLMHPVVNYFIYGGAIVVFFSRAMMKASVDSVEIKIFKNIS